MEIDALQPTRLGRSPFCLLWPSSPAVCGASSSGKGVPSRQPCPPSPPPSLAPAGPLGPGLRTDTPLPNTEWEGPSCGSPARSPSQGTGSRAEGMAGAAEGPGPRHRGPGAAAGGGGGAAWWSRGKQGGSLSPAQPWHETQESWSRRGTQWEIALPPGSLLKGARSLKGACWAGQGRREASALGSERSAFPRAVTSS